MDRPGHECRLFFVRGASGKLATERYELCPWEQTVEALRISRHARRPRHYRRSLQTAGIVAFVIGSVVLFLASLTQPAVHLDGSTTGQRWECLRLLCIGWIGLLGKVYAWLANPALLAGWVLLLVRRNGRGALILILSLGFALSFLRETRWERNEAGVNTALITGHAIGYWLWIASIATALAGGLVAIVFDRLAPLRSSASDA